MGRFVIAAVLLLLLPAFSLAKTPQQCLDDLTACSDTCCQEHGGTTVTDGEGTAAHCTAFEDSREFQSTCLDPCLTPYNYCMMGTTGSSSSPSPFSMCCGGGFIVLSAGLGCILLAWRS